MSQDAGALLFVYRDCLFTVAAGVQPPKAGSLVFCRHLTFRPDEWVCEIGAGIGLAAVLAARAGCQVIATDLLPERRDRAPTVRAMLDGPRRYLTYGQYAKVREKITRRVTQELGAVLRSA